MDARQGPVIQQFQSTRQHKPRRSMATEEVGGIYFNPRGNISLDDDRIRQRNPADISIHEAT